MRSFDKSKVYKSSSLGTQKRLKGWIQRQLTGQIPTCLEEIGFVLVRPSADWMRPSQITDDNLLHSKSTSLNAISSKNTMREIYRIRFNQAFEHHCPIKLTHKINLHTLLQIMEGVLCGINFLNHILLVFMQILPVSLPRIAFSQIHKRIHFLSIFIFPYVASFFFSLSYVWSHSLVLCFCGDFFLVCFCFLTLQFLHWLLLSWFCSKLLHLHIIFFPLRKDFSDSPSIYFLY